MNPYALENPRPRNSQSKPRNNTLTRTESAPNTYSDLMPVTHVFALWQNLQISIIFQCSYHINHNPLLSIPSVNQTTGMKGRKCQKASLHLRLGFEHALILISKSDIWVSHIPV